MKRMEENGKEGKLVHDGNKDEYAANDRPR